MQTFDARRFTPQQGFDKHPAGMFPFMIANTYGKQNSNGSGYHFVVEFKSDVGQISNNYNLWHSNAQTVEIANKELSALCYAIGIFQMSFPTNPDGSPNLAMFGAEIRGGRGRMEVAPQKNNAEYMEVKRVFDVNGNEPGKPAVQGQPQGQPQGNADWGQQGQPQQAAQAQPNPPQNPPPGAPMTQQPGGGWGNPPQQTAQPNPPPNQGGWSNPPPNNAGTGAAPNKPPWG